MFVFCSFDIRVEVKCLTEELISVVVLVVKIHRNGEA